MKAAELRKSILQAAVEGKLVPQDPNDEPASILLERIKQQKEQLIRDGKIKKEKPNTPISDDEIPFNLPNEWAWCRLGDLCEIITKGSSPKWQGVGYTEQSADSVLFITSENVGTEKLIFRNQKYVEKRFNEIQPRSILKRNDILTNIVGASIGRSCIYTLDNNDCNINQAVALVRLVDRDLCNFIVKYLNSNMAFELMMDKQVESARANISLTSLASFLVPLPPSEEQSRIVDKLDKLMVLCDSLETAEKELDVLESHFTEYLPKSILQAAVQGKLVAQDPNDESATELLKRIKHEKEGLVRDGKIKKDKPLPPINEDEIPYELPDGWVWCRLGEIAQFINGDSGKNYPSKDKLSSIGIPFISAVNIENGTVSENKLLFVNQEQYDALGSGKLKKDDVAFCIRGSLGKCAIYPFDSGAIASSLVIIRLYTDSTASLRYLFSYLISPLLYDEIKKYDNGTAQPNLSAENLKSFLFPLPPLAEQQNIITKIEELMAMCDELKSAHTLPVLRNVTEVSNITPFPQKSRPKPVSDRVIPIGIAARGDATDGLSEQASRDADELLGDD